MSKIIQIGCGAMGGMLASAFLNAGNEVTVVDLAKNLAEPLIERGAGYSSSLKEAPKADIIIASLPTYGIIRKILEPCLAEEHAGSVLINMSTSNCLSDITDIEGIAKERGMRYIEAKIECYPENIGPDSGYIVYSGDKELFDEVYPAVTALGQAKYLGSNITSAAVCDTASIGAHGAASAALVEGCAFCLKAGLPVEAWIDVISYALPLSLKINYQNLAEGLKNYTGEFPDRPGTDMSIELRGEGFVKSMMNSVGVNSLITDAVYDIFQKSVDEGYAKKDLIALVNLMMNQ